MRKLRVGIIDLVANSPTKALWARVMNGNFASIMPQAVAVWCEEMGHDVTYFCYTGAENVVEELPEDVDLVFIGAFTEAAQLAYALSALFRSRGAATAIGGPHARCYPQDAQKYFDYVLGFTDKGTIQDVLADSSPHRPLGLRLAANQQPLELPGVRERWQFIETTLRKAPFIQIVPMIASLGCPYTCSFCIDSVVPHQPLQVELLKDDLRFLLTKVKRPLVGWHDPNFGVRFDDCIGAIEDAVPPDSVDFIAESTLSLLSEEHVVRLKRNGFKALLPGIESWYEVGGKSKTGARNGMDKVRQVADQVNMILRYIPYVQANFVSGLDSDEGPEPFELTKRFLTMAPGSFPAFSLLTAFGEAAPLNLEYQRANRILGFPFHFLNNNGAMNVKPLNYTWPDFYDHVIDLSKHAFSWKAIARRFTAIKNFKATWLNVARAVSSEGFGRIKYYSDIRRKLDADREFRSYFEQQTDDLPGFYPDRIRGDLGGFWEWLPDGAVHHEPHAYLHSQAPPGMAGVQSEAV